MNKIVHSIVVVSLSLAGGRVPAQSPASAQAGNAKRAADIDNEHYVLGPGDQVQISALNAEEIPQHPFRIETSGMLDLPMVGAIQAGGMTIDQLRGEIAKRLGTWVKSPQVSVNLTESRSQPISVLGEVTEPGVIQIDGNKTLFEVLSMARGLRPDAGNRILITRQQKYGHIPLSNETSNSEGYYVASVNVHSVIEAKDPAQNIVVRPHDVITVPKGELVYVIGQVHKPGGFLLNEKENVSALKALSMAEGLGSNAFTAKAKILRVQAQNDQRLELNINLKGILAGKSPDVAMQPEDILFIPDNTAHSAMRKGLESMLQLGTGIAIYRR